MSVCEHLRCPSCRAAMQPAAGVEPGADGAGILTCQCAEHPVLDGIVCINDAGSEWREGSRVLARLKSGRRDLAVAEALLGSYRHVARRIAGRLERAGVKVPSIAHERLCRHLVRRLCRERITFERAVRQLRKRDYAMYLTQRWAIPSQHAAVPLILLLGLLRHDGASGNRPVRVLEIAGGAGHACTLMIRYHPQHEVILTDGDFGNLWLARRFVAPGAAAYVRINAERTLPFVGASMDAIFCCDALHFMRNQEGLAAEMDRVTRAEGAWLLPHLHNVLRTNVSPGRARTADGWAECLGSRRTVRIVSETRILEDFVARERLDLGVQDEPEALAASNALAAIAGPEVLWRAHELRPRFHDGAIGLQVNPAYAARPGWNGSVRLRRRRFRGLLGLEAAAATHLPKQVKVDGGLLEALQHGRVAREHEAALAELRRLMVVTPGNGLPRVAAGAARDGFAIKHTREDSNLRPAV